MLDAASPPRNLRVLNFLFKEGLGSTLGRCCAIVITPGVITVPASLHIDVLKSAQIRGQRAISEIAILTPFQSDQLWYQHRRSTR